MIKCNIGVVESTHQPNVEICMGRNGADLFDSYDQKILMVALLQPRRKHGADNALPIGLDHRHKRRLHLRLLKPACEMTARV